jgi:hypothetical protein
VLFFDRNETIKYFFIVAMLKLFGTLFISLLG